MRMFLPVLVLPLLLFFACDDSTSTTNNANNVNNVNNANNVNNLNNVNNVNNVNNLNNLNNATCDFTDPLAGMPAFTPPAREEWNHSIITGGTVAAGSPYHMIHDEMAGPAETITLRAKFDYGALLHKDLQDEWVVFFLWGGEMTGWQELGRHLTDDDGQITLQVGPLPVGTYLVRAVVPGDLSSAEGYVTVVAPGRRAVAFDIDGTLTTSDAEVMQDWANFSTAEMYPFADQVVAYHRDRGYQIVMVTGRPYWLATNTRGWLRDRGMPATSVRFTSDNGTTVSGQETQAYKTEYLQDLITRCGLVLIRAYGNATTDIGAYAAVSVPKAETFIIGEHAGAEETQPVVCEGCGYRDHYQSFLLSEDLACGLP